MSKAIAGVQRYENNSTPMKMGYSAHKNTMPCEHGCSNKDLNHVVMGLDQGADRLAVENIDHLVMAPTELARPPIPRQYPHRALAVTHHLLNHCPQTVDRALHSPSDCEGELAHDRLGVPAFGNRI